VDAIHLRCRGLQNPSVNALGQAEHVDGPVHARFSGLDRVMLVVDRRRGAGEIVDTINLDIEWKADVVANRLETWLV